MTKATVETPAGKVFPDVSMDAQVAIKPDASGGRQRTCHKRRWIAVTTVLSILLTLTVACILFLNFYQRKEIIINQTTITYIGGKEVKEVVYLDSKDSLMQYHFTNEDEETWVILDLNRDLEITKIQKGSASSVCFLSPITALNPRFPSPGNDSNNATAPDKQYGLANRSNVVGFRKSRSSLKTTSILGPSGEDLCKDVDVFWSLPICDRDSEDSNTTDSSSGRNRRKRSYWYQWCRWDWSNCYYYTFADQSYRNYYRCGITCTWMWL